MADLEKLTALGAVADEIDGEGPPTPEQIEKQKQEAEAVTEAAAWAQIPAMVGGVLGMLAPELAAVYSEEACLKWGEEMVPVSQKYGWNGPSNMPEIKVAITTIGFVVPTYLVMRVKLQQLKEARESHQAAKDAAMGKTVVPSPVTDVGVVHGSGT